MPEAAAKGLSFADIIEMYDEVKQHDPSYAKMTLPEFSQWAQRETGADFSMGMRDSKLKRLSAGIDRVLRPVSEPLTETGSWLTSLVTDNPRYQQMGGEILGAAPRGFVNLATAIPAAVAATSAVAAGAPLAVGGAAGAAGLGISALLTGSDVYEKTDNIPASLIGAGSAALLPASSYVGQKAAVSALQKFMGPQAFKVGSQTLVGPNISKAPGFVVQRGVEAAGEAAAQTINQEVAMQLTDVVMGQKTPLDEHLFQLFGSQLPFAPVIGYHALSGPKKVAGKAVDFQSLTDANTSIKLSEIHAAADAYHAAEVMRKFEDTNKRLEWRPVLSTPEEPLPGHTKWIEAETPAGKVRISEAGKSYYDALVYQLSKGEKVSLEELYTKYQVPPSVGSEIMNLMQKRGVTAPPDQNGAAKVVASVEPSNAAIVTEALSENADIKLPKRDVKQSAQEAGLREELEKLQMEGKGETPEAEAIRQQIRDSIDDPQAIAINRLAQGMFKDDPQIQDALARFKQQLTESGTKAVSVAGDVDSIEAIVTKLAKGEVLTMPELQRVSSMNNTERAMLTEKVSEATTPPKDLAESELDLTPDSATPTSKTPEQTKGEYYAELNKKARGTDPEQIVAQTKTVLGESVGQRLERPVVRQSVDEVLTRVQDITRTVHTLLKTAFRAQPLDVMMSVTSEKKERAIRKHVQALYESGRYMSEAEVAARAYNVAKRRLAQQIRAAWFAKHAAEAGEMAPQNFDRPFIRERLARLNEMPEPVLRELVLASQKMSNIPGTPTDLLHWFYAEGVRQWEAQGAPKELTFLKNEKGEVVLHNKIPVLDEASGEWMAKFQEAFSGKQPGWYINRYKKLFADMPVMVAEGALAERGIVGKGVKSMESEGPVTQRVGLDVVMEDEMSPEQLAVQHAIETELQDAPAKLTLEDWSSIGRVLGAERNVKSSMIKPLNILLTALRDGHLIYENYRGNIRLRFINSEVVEMHDVATITGMTLPQFEKFINNHAYRYIDGYIQKYMPQTYEQVMKRKSLFEARQEAAKAEAERRAQLQKELQDEMASGVESKTTTFEQDTQDLQRLGEKTGGAVDPMLINPPMRSAYAPQIGAQLWFEKYFRNRGLAGSDLDAMRDMAVRIATFASKDVSYVRIGEMVGQNVAGTFFPSWKRWNALVGLVPVGTANLAFDKFHKNLVLGHELFHAQQWDAVQGQSEIKRRTFQNIETIAKKYTPSERSTIIGDMFRLVVPENVMKSGEVLQYIALRQDEAAMSPSEFLADYSAMMVAGLASSEPKKVQYFRDLVKFSSAEEQDFARMLYVSVADMTDSIADYLDATIGKSRPSEKDAAGSVFEDLSKNVKGALLDLKEVDAVVDRFRQLEAFEPDAWALMVQNAEVPVFDKDTFAAWRKGVVKGADWADSKRPDVFKEAAALLGLGTKKLAEETLGQDPGFFRSTFMPAAQLSEQFPLLQPAFKVAFQFRSQANDMMTRMLTPFLAATKGREGHIDVEVNGVKKVLGDEKANSAANQIALRKQDEQRILSDVEMRSMMPGLKPDVQQAVIDFHRAAEATRPLIGEVWTKVMFDRIALGAAKMLMLKNKALSAEDAMTLGTELRNTVYATMGAKKVAGTENIPPMQSADAQAALAALQKRVGDNGAFMAARDLVFGRMQHIGKLLDTFQDEQGQWKTWYMSEVRSGQFFARTYDQQGKFIAANGFQDKSAMLAFAEQQKQKGYTVKTTDKYAESDKFSGLDPRLVTASAEAERAEYARAKAALGENTPEFDAYKEFFDNLEAVFTPGAASETMLKSRGYEKHLIQRKAVGGREDVNMVEGFFKHIETISSGLSRAYAKEKANVLLDDPQLKENQYLHNTARQHLTNVLYPSAKEWTGFKNLIFNYFLGFNVSSMLIEGSQPLLTVVPELVRKGSGIGEAYSRLAASAMDIAKASSKGGKFENPDVEAAVQRAYKNQVLDFGLHHDLENQTSLAVSNLRALTQGGVIHKAGQALLTPVGWYTQAARALYSQGPKFNAKLTFVTAFKMGLEKTGDAAKAYDFAEQMVRTANYTGGAAARPVGLFARAGKFQGALGAAMSLQTYTLSATFQMFRYLSDAIDNQMPQSERAQAKKALVQMVATQFAFAGAMGMPMAAAGLALLDQMFPQWELKKNLRMTLTKLAGDDAEFGGQVADVALKGFANKVLPGDIDFASRLGLGNFFGVNEYEGFSFKNLFGPGAAVLEAGVSGGQRLMSGEFDKAAETLLPNALKNVVRMHNDGYQFRDAEGRKLFDGTETDKVLYSFGLKTAKLSSLREEQRLVKRSEELAAKELRQFHAELAAMLEKGDTLGVKERLLQKQQSDSLYDARAGARAVARMVIDRRYPVDPIRTGIRTNVDERQQIASTYAQRPVPGEVQRVLETKGVEKSLGILGVGMMPTRAELTRAQMIDRLRQMYPTMSRQMAAIVVEQRLNPRAGQERVQM